MLLELLNVDDFEKYPSTRFSRQRVLNAGVGNAAEFDARTMFPCVVSHRGRPETRIALFVESAQIRKEWFEKLRDAIGLRCAVQESDKVR